MSKSELKWISELGKNPPIIAASCDLNGIWRGKRVPLANLEKVLYEGIRIPLSASCLDIWGSDLINSPFLFESGDADGYGLPTGIGPVPFFSNKKDSVLIPLWLFDNKKNISPIDPRHILNSVCKKYEDLNLYPVIAFELEFYLLNENNFKNIKFEQNDFTNVLSITDIEDHEVFFDELHDLCEKNKIPMDGISSENAPNQFEINLKHTADPLKAADQAILFKRFIKGIAKKHEMLTILSEMRNNCLIPNELEDLLGSEFLRGSYESKMVQDLANNGITLLHNSFDLLAHLETNYPDSKSKWVIEIEHCLHDKENNGPYLHTIFTT